MHTQYSLSSVLLCVEICTCVMRACVCFRVAFDAWLVATTTSMRVLRDVSVEERATRG